MFRQLRRTILPALLFITGCTRHVPTPTPTPINARPDWSHVTKTTGCLANGGLPDSGCTPGNINPALTKDVICGPSFHTGDYRDKETTPTQKAETYAMYSIPRPSQNTGANQKCELDHLISLELGGADDLSNIWPECCAGYAGWTAAGFRDKDKFENYLHRMVCAGSVSLTDAQIEISTNWFRYWTETGKPNR